MILHYICSHHAALQMHIREKIWDQVPGAHFITEAGGKVTDLKGRYLDFSKGRYLDEDVTGIVASNGQYHNKIIEILSSIKK